MRAIFCLYLNTDCSGSLFYGLSSLSQVHKKRFKLLNIKAICFVQLAREVLDIAAMMVKPGVTTEEIDHAVHLVNIHSLFSFSNLNIAK